LIIVSRLLLQLRLSLSLFLGFGSPCFAAVALWSIPKILQILQSKQKDIRIDVVLRSVRGRLFGTFAVCRVGIPSGVFGCAFFGG
jgi:hypothetical protein